MKKIIYLLLPLICIELQAKVLTGLDLFFAKGYVKEYQDLRVGLVTNHTGVDSKGKSAIDLFSEAKQIKLAAIFAPEHGLDGSGYANQQIEKGYYGKIPIETLFGKTYRPTPEMLSGVDLIVYDIQDVGVRCYTYITTLFFMMEACAKKKLPLVVLDRPNPINGVMIDGPMLDEGMRCFSSYINVPYCHGMTVGELALFFNVEYKIGCNLRVIPMEGWTRTMSFQETGLTWVPTSPNIPEHTTPICYATTGLLGELGLVNIGVGYSLPFKLIGAPWIKGKDLAKQLDSYNLKGVRFIPYVFRPFFGLYKAERCEGVKIEVESHLTFHPIEAFFAIAESLKKLYPQEVEQRSTQAKKGRREVFSRICGTEKILEMIQKKDSFFGNAILIHQKEKKDFLEKRSLYLLYS